MNDKEIISGVIFDPIKNEIFYAEKDTGAFLNNQRIRVSKKNNLSDCLFATNLESIKNMDLNLRISGSAALDLAYVGCGRLDGFFQKTKYLGYCRRHNYSGEEAGGNINNIDLKIKNHNIIAHLK